MDVESALKDQFFRPLIRTIVPGAIATAPWVEWVATSVSRVDGFRQAQPLGFILLAGIVAIAAGLVLEDLGSRIETALDDWGSGRVRDGEQPGSVEHRDCWDAYLALGESTRTHADDYLDSILLRFKFELSMVPALISCAIGLETLFVAVPEPVPVSIVVASVVIPAGVALYLWFETRASWSLLHRIRSEIVRAARSNAPTAAAGVAVDG